ncbi:Hypothetical protein LUCI_4406 [Lucifera butyrica]|uniref:Uncharacterized protein n=1 Tax=Lucifera butyrica TaxID=1351585 RepID=A0A498RE75_9FIRM|nr:hypothetical protein [Lucifera butyrica]VBB09120.1 Hypothetical protein LUCI_4406 [Lucifera butyrica]
MIKQRSQCPETDTNELLTFVRTNPTLNQSARESLLDARKKEKWIAAAARAITVFAFHNGPAESMQAQGKLSRGDMEKMNLFMTSHLTYVFQLIFSERWFEFKTLIETYNLSGLHGDDPGAINKNFAALEQMILDCFFASEMPDSENSVVVQNSQI